MPITKRHKVRTTSLKRMASKDKVLARKPSAAAAKMEVLQPAHQLHGSKLLANFIDSEGFVQVELVANRFGVSKGQLADTIGLPREAMHRVARVRNQKAQRRTTEMLEIVGRVIDWAGGERQALAWYRAEPLPAFGGRTAEALVKEGKAAAVRDYLDEVATGAFA